MPIPEDYEPLPGRTGPGQNPWYVSRDAWDAEVERRLEGYLSPDGLNNTFVTAVQVIANGTDQTAQINAALAQGASMGLRKLVRLVGDFTVTAPLRVHSKTVLDAYAASVKLAQNTNRNLLQNAAVQANRRFLDATIAGGSLSTLTSATAAFVSGDIGRRVYVQGAGPSGATLSTTIAAVGSSTSVTLATAATAAVTGQYASIGDRESEIVVQGGVWIRDYNNNLRDSTHKGWDSNTLRFRHADGIRVIDATVDVRSGKYAINFGDCTDFQSIGSKTTAGTFSDLVHINGPAQHFVIRDTYSAGSGDDIVSLTGGDFMTIDSMGDTGGSIKDGDIDGVRTEQSTHAEHYSRAVLLLAGQTPNAVNQFSIERVTVRNVKSKLKATPIFVGEDDQDTGTMGGTYSDICIDNVRNVAPPAGAPSQIVLLRDGVMNRIDIRNVSGSGTSTAVLIGAEADVTDLSTYGIARSQITVAGILRASKLSAVPPYPTPGTNGTETVPRALLRATDQVQFVSGEIYLSYFRVDSGLSVTQMGDYTGGTGAAGTTLAKKGLYRLNSDGSLTRIATFSAGTLWNTPNVATGPHAFGEGAVLLNPATTYATADLFVGSTPPKLIGIDGIASELGKGDVIAKKVTGQTDLPATIASGSLAASAFRVYHRIT